MPAGPVAAWPRRSHPPSGHRRRRTNKFATNQTGTGQPGISSSSCIVYGREERPAAAAAACSPAPRPSMRGSRCSAGGVRADRRDGGPADDSKTAECGGHRLTAVRCLASALALSATDLDALVNAWSGWPSPARGVSDARPAGRSSMSAEASACPADCCPTSEPAIRGKGRGAFFFAAREIQWDYVHSEVLPRGSPSCGRSSATGRSSTGR